MKTHSPLTLFIVEDNNLFRIALKSDIETAFANRPLVIHMFDTGEACLEKFDEHKPGIVILDYNLNSSNPEAMDGVHVLDRIKYKNPDTLVVILTSEDNVEIATRAFKHGASDYVVKTETKFRKINYSLLNLIRIIETRAETRRYRTISVGLFVSIVLIAGGAIAIQIFSPFLIN